MQIFEYTPLSQTEMEVVAACFCNPAVQKYLSHLAKEAAKDIVYGEPVINESPESYLRRLALVKGRLEAVNALLQIETAN